MEASHRTCFQPLSLPLARPATWPPPVATPKSHHHTPDTLSYETLASSNVIYVAVVETVVLKKKKKRVQALVNVQCSTTVQPVKTFLSCTNGGNIYFGLVSVMMMMIKTAHIITTIAHPLDTPNLTQVIKNTKKQALGVLVMAQW